VCASLADSKKHTFGGFITEFYARRLARIIPALVLMLVTASTLSTLFIPSAWLNRFSDGTALYAFFGLSNWQMAHNTDTYFGPTAEFNPYMHTWSLGLEEQFYVIFPLLCFLWVRSRHRRSRRTFMAAGILALIGTVSLAACAWATRHQPVAAFYSIWFRFWELGAGALLYELTAGEPSYSGGRLRAGLAKFGPWLGLAAIATGYSLRNHFCFLFLGL
jgi:peptidoglycan/LPS O-acetylase OafA/YrhL